MCWQVIAPYDAEDSRGLLKAAIRDPDPVVFLENEILYGESFPISEEALSKDYVLPIGKAKVRPRGLADMTWSRGFANCGRIAAELSFSQMLNSLTA